MNVKTLNLNFGRPNFTRWLAAGLSAAGIVCVLWCVPAARAQGPGRMTCGSDGYRVTCDANTAGGVRLDHQLDGSSRCEEGRSWGYTERGIWVDRGCRAEFDLGNRNEAYTRVDPGTQIVVRTNDLIQASRTDYRVYTGTVDQDVRGSNGLVGIPRGSQVELIVRREPDNDLVLDLESVTVNGQRYAIETGTERIDSPGGGVGVGANKRTGEYVGGGAILGTILGAIAGGGKGAAIGAAAGAAAGAGTQTITKGRAVHVPPETLLTFRLDQALHIGVVDRGVDRDGYHYHDYYNNPPRG